MHGYGSICICGYACAHTGYIHCRLANAEIRELGFALAGASLLCLCERERAETAKKKCPVRVDPDGLIFTGRMVAER